MAVMPANVTESLQRDNCAEKAQWPPNCGSTPEGSVAEHARCHSVRQTASTVAYTGQQVLNQRLGLARIEYGIRPPRAVESPGLQRRANSRPMAWLCMARWNLGSRHEPASARCRLRPSGGGLSIHDPIRSTDTPSSRAAHPCGGQRHIDQLEFAARAVLAPQGVPPRCRTRKYPKLIVPTPEENEP